MKQQIVHYAAQFEEEYLLQPDGQKHHEAYSTEREEVSKYWDEIKKAKKAGKSITDMVLRKLLPYTNTRYNREMGNRISIAPGVIKDIRKWFEGAGWQESDNWDKVALAIFDLTYDLIEKEDLGSLAKFEQMPESKGFKSGLLSPTFYFLNERFRLINAKTVNTLNFIADKTVIGRDLTNYGEHIKTIDLILDELSIPLFDEYDNFDAFCHWMCDKRLGGYARYEKPSDEFIEEPAIGEERFEESEPSGHWEAIYYIVKTGNLLGYKTYVSDPSKIAFDEKLGNLATIKEVPQLLRNASEIKRVDAIWYKSQPPFFLFEVEDGGTMREALHRLYNAMAFDARFIVVCPPKNRKKFEKWVSTQPFLEFRDRYQYRTYSELFEFYKTVRSFIAMRQRFLNVPKHIKSH